MAREGEPPSFKAPTRRFPDASACARHLSEIVEVGRAAGDAAARGPYQIGRGDVRAHRVHAAGLGHEIVEYRCLGGELSARRWSPPGGDVAPLTIERIANMSFEGG